MIRVVFPVSAQREGLRVEPQKGIRICRELELNLRIKPRQRIVRKNPEPLNVTETNNQCWSMDFKHDQLSDGRSFRLFNEIDDFNRETLAINIDLSLPAERVVRALSGDGGNKGLKALCGFTNRIELNLITAIK